MSQLGALGQTVTLGLRTKKMVQLTYSDMRIIMFHLLILQAMVKRSSLTIADLVGCFDPPTAVGYLALFQVLMMFHSSTLHIDSVPPLELCSIPTAILSADQCSV